MFASACGWTCGRSFQSIRQHASECVQSIRQHTSGALQAPASGPAGRAGVGGARGRRPVRAAARCCLRSAGSPAHSPAYVSIRQHTSAYVSSGALLSEVRGSPARSPADTHEALSYRYMRLKLLVYEALRYQCMRPYATSV